MNNLKVTNLTYDYKTENALNNLSFEVNDGLVGVLGPNGAGKSTLIKILATLLINENGSVKLNDIDYKKDIKNIRKDVGYLPQDFSIYNNVKGREFLEIIASLKGIESEEKINELINSLIEEFKMEKYINRKFGEYSGGMKQKLGFAQAVLGEPKLLLMDEPTVGLDPEQRNIIRELFPYLSKDRIILVATHIVEDIENYCKYLLIIKDGQVLYSGTKKNLLENMTGYIWEDEMIQSVFDEEKDRIKVITTLLLEDSIRFKYISKKPLSSSSRKVEISLQDAYIAKTTIHEKRWEI